MPAISVGSVEVDVVPNAQGIDARLRAALVPPASQIGDEVGRIIGRQIAAQMAPAIRDGINNGARAARPAATRQGDETAGAFSRALKARLEAAFRSLPKADVRLSDTGFDADMARLRARLESLSGKRIGIDVDAGTALAEITDIEARLKRLGAEHPNVQVRADTARALAELAALRAEVDAVDGKNVDVDASSATASINGLVFAALALGPALIPVLPVIAAGLGAVAAAGTAAAAGIGSVALVAVPAFKQIGAVLQAQKAAQDAATNSTLRGGQANSQGASQALQMAGAQQALATARRNAARQIADAERGVGDAVRQAAQANAQAAAQVKQARQSLADAYAQAADRMEQANEQVTQAERDLATAQKGARQAQLDLTAARAEASRQLQDMNNQLTDSRLSERDAEIALKEAAAQRNAVLDNPNASALDKQKAILQYDEAVQRLKEQRLETQRLQSDTAKANKAGVDGSDTVKSAQERLAAAQQDVVDKTTALKKAQDNVAKTQIQNTRAIADAQEKLSEAQKNVAETQRSGAESIARAQERVVQAQQSGADSIASAQRQIASASLSAAGGVDQAAIAQAKYQAALAKLTPAARDTLNAFVSLRTAFGAWSRSLQPAVMPIFTRALVSLRNTLPTLTPFVLGAAGAIKTLQDRASTSLKSPFWQGFKQDLQTNVRPAIIGLGVAFGNVIKGMAGVVDAFLPHMNGISSNLQRITGRFANWGANLKGSPEFENFLSFVSDHGPILAQALGDIGGAFLRVSEALSPLSGPFLQLLGGLANVIGTIAEQAPWFIQLIYGIILATKLWTLAQIAFNFVMNANPLVRIGLAILALVAFVIYAYNRWGWFRTAVQTAWAAIQTAALFAWNNILKPVFGALVLAVQTVGRWAMWLWTNAIRPAWNAISLAARILLTAIVVIVILPIIAAIKILGAIGMWLWTHALRPAFQGIAAVARWLWTTVFRPVFQQIGDKAKWLYNNAIKPTWNAIVTVSRWLWNTVLKPLLKAFWQGLQTLGGWAKWLYSKAIKPAWDAIVSVGRSAWKVGIKPIFDKFKDIVHSLKSAFDTAVSGIKKAWDKIKSVSKAPVQFVVDTVYNHGIVGVWNKVAGAFGAPKLKSYKFATGGILPGYTPGRDVHLAALSGGEAVMRPEWTRAVGPGYINSMNAAARGGGVTGVQRALGLPAFKDGGIFGWIGKGLNKVAGVGSKAWNTVKKGASWLKDTLEASARAGVKRVVNPLLSRIPGLNTGFGKMVKRIPQKIVDAIFGFAKKADGKGGAGGGSIGGKIPQGQRLAIINQALAAAHVPPPGALAQWQAGLNTLITRESGWNASAINRWDSNAKAGHPSQGLAQTIPGTFNAYVPKSLKSRGILDPVANVAAAIRYIVSRYGNITRVQQANATKPPAGYDSGGFLQPGMNLAFNGTGRPEPVLTTAQWNAIQGASVRGGDGASAPARFEGDLYLDSGEFLGKVRGEAAAVMHEGQQELISVIRAS